MNETIFMPESSHSYGLQEYLIAYNTLDIRIVKISKIEFCSPFRFTTSGTEVPDKRIAVSGAD
jgi:hypothetical protein